MKRSSTSSFLEKIALAVVGTMVISAPAGAGTWTQIAGVYPGNVNGPANMIVLPDGRVLSSDAEVGTRWFTLTPNNNGSYASGTWTQVSDSNLGRLFNPAFILRDGRYFICGGEYVSDELERVSHKTGADRARCEIFDPVTDSWTIAPDMPETIADSPAAGLADGRIMDLTHFGTHHSFVFDAAAAPPAWHLVAPYDGEVIVPEGSSLLLRDGSVLYGNFRFQRYLPASGQEVGQWVDTASTSTIPGGVDRGQFSFGNYDGEMGPTLLLYDGRVLVLGGSEKNGLYTPPAPNDPTGPGSWAAAADTPGTLSHGDSPGAVEPDGRALTTAVADAAGVHPGTLYEYTPDGPVFPAAPAGGSWAPVTAPSPLGAGNRMRMVNLPRGSQSTGQILVTGTLDGTVWLYQAAGQPASAWRPSLTTVSGPTAGEFTLTGTQLNGLTTGSDLGDDAKMGTNFPIVYLTDSSGHVYYARSYNFDQMAPRPASAGTGSCKFRLPNILPNASYQIHVSASGVASSNTRPLTISGIHVTEITGAAVGQNPGSGVTWFVNLSANATSSNRRVNLTSSDTSVATVPAFVDVPVGARSASFTVTSQGFGSATISAVTSTPHASFGSARKVFGWSVSSVASPSPAAGQHIPPGVGTSTWTVNISTPAPSLGVVVNLQSSNPAAATVPATVTVPSGQTSVSFVVTRGSWIGGTSTIMATLRNSTRSYTVDSYDPNWVAPAFAAM